MVGNSTPCHENKTWSAKNELVSGTSDNLYWQRGWEKKNIYSWNGPGLSPAEILWESPGTVQLKTT